jgi:hypothetical protein
MTVAQFIEKKSGTPNLPVRKPPRRGYEVALRQHVLPELGTSRLVEVTPERVQSFINCQAGGMAWNTVRNIRPVADAARHSGAYWTKVMAGQDFSGPDRVDPASFNHALWRGLKGDEPHPATPTGTDLRTNRATISARTKAADTGHPQRRLKHMKKRRTFFDCIEALLTVSSNARSIHRTDLTGTPRSVANSRPGRALQRWMIFVSIIILFVEVLFLAYRMGIRNVLNFTIQ